MLKSITQTTRNSQKGLAITALISWFVWPFYAFQMAFPLYDMLQSHREQESAKNDLVLLY